MDETSVLYTIFLIFTGGALIATAVLFAKQSVLLAYIALGIIAGPHVLGLVPDPELVDNIASIGIIFLLFLLGLNLEPDELLKLLREATVVTLLSSATFGLCGFVISMSFDFSPTDSLVIAAAMMFSSTIIGLKLLPTSALHHQRMGEIIISILLLQDIIAVTVLLLVEGLGSGNSALPRITLMLLALPTLIATAYFVSKKLLSRLFQKFDQINEYIFLLTIGWCMGIAELAHVVSLSHEVGAFIAGVTLAANPIARYIAETLKPLRDFFLVMFFFGLGAGFDIVAVPQVLLPATLIAAAMIVLKPLIFNLLLRRENEKTTLASEIGVRLGQISEFSLMVAVVALSAGVISERASLLVQTATIMTFVFSSYWVVKFYPTPIATSAALRRD